MPTVVEERVDLGLVADLAEVLLVLGDEVLHPAAAVTPPGPEAAHVRVPRLGVHELALAVHDVVAPVADVLVAVLEPHPAVPASLAGREGAGVGVPLRRDVRALAVEEAVVDVAAVEVAGEVVARDEAVCREA